MSHWRLIPHWLRWIYDGFKYAKRDDCCRMHERATSPVLATVRTSGDPHFMRPRSFHIVHCGHSLLHVCSKSHICTYSVSLLLDLPSFELNMSTNDVDDQQLKCKNEWNKKDWRMMLRYWWPIPFRRMVSTLMQILLAINWQSSDLSG